MPIQVPGQARVTAGLAGPGEGSEIKQVLDFRPGRMVLPVGSKLGSLDDFDRTFDDHRIGGDVLVAAAAGLRQVPVIPDFFQHVLTIHHPAYAQHGIAPAL